jgi:hypothetical protein
MTLTRWWLRDEGKAWRLACASCRVARKRSDAEGLVAVRDK